MTHLSSTIQSGVNQAILRPRAASNRLEEQLSWNEGYLTDYLS